MQTTPFSTHDLDRDAVAIVAHLQDEGYGAYLVGGCVRDLLLGVTPKDFDIATAARPEELKDVFGRRCRLIGRRFKLAHVRSGAKIFEVATFRGRPEDQDIQDDSGFVVRANTYGSPEEDALSRDFTINGLFYDPVAGTLHDHVDGLADVSDRRLRTIGDAAQRFREDPVRLLRAVKFSGRLGLQLDPTIVEVAAEYAPLVHECPVARVTEELFRLVETGHAAPTLQIMSDLGILEPVLPELTACVAPRWEEWMAWVQQVDRVVRAHGVLPRESTFVLLAWPLLRDELAEAPEAGRVDWGKAVAARIQEASVRMTIPIRYRQLLRATANVMRRLLYPTRRRRRGMLVRAPALPVALTLLRIEYVLGTGDRAVYEEWGEALARLGVTNAPFEPRLEDAADPHGPAPRRGRRRPRAEGEQHEGERHEDEDEDADRDVPE